MAIKRPDIYEHNNPRNAFVDSDFVRGGFRTSVESPQELFNLDVKSDQLKEYATFVYVKSEEKVYTLVDKDNIENINGWSTSVVVSGTSLQSDWEQQDSQEADYIKNKPTKTSDFKNDGEDGIHRYITEADLKDGNVVLNGGFYRIEGLEYFVWADRYIINNRLRADYISDSLTLDPPDSKHDRIDVIVINDNDTFSIITGQPDTKPIKPRFDEVNQVELTFVFVKANHIPAEDNYMIYNENLGIAGGEADTSTDSTKVLLENIEQKYSGNKSIKINKSIGNDSVLFSLPEVLNTREYNKLVLFIFVSQPAYYSGFVKFLFDGEYVKSYLLNISNVYGSGSWVQDWKPIILDMVSDFEFDAIEIEITSIDSVFWIDYIFLQRGNFTIAGPQIERTSQLINDGEFGTGKFIEEVDLEGYIREGFDTKEQIEFISIEDEDPENRENTIYELRTRFNLVQNTEYTLFKAHGNRRFDQVEEGDIVEGFMYDGLIQVFFKGIYIGSGDIDKVASYDLIESFQVTNTHAPAPIYNRLFTIKGSEEIGPPPFLDYIPFIFKVDTSLEGKTGNYTVELPMHPEGNYDFIVDWGDGQTDYVRYYGQGEATHTYATSGIYTVTVRGVFEGIVGSASINPWSNDINKIIEVVQFGDLRLGNEGSYFRNARNLAIMANDLNSPGTTDYSYAWQNNHSLPAFPIIDMSNATSVRAAWMNNRFQTFPLIDLSNVTNFEEAWEGSNNLISFPLIDTSKGKNFKQTWRNNRSLPAFPLLNFENGTLFNRTWQNCILFEDFPHINTSKGQQFQGTWNNCSNLISFPAIDTSKGNRFYHCWLGCKKLESFPELDLSKGKTFEWAFRDIGKENSNNGVLTSFGTYKFDSGDNFRGAFMDTELPTSDYDRILNRLASHNPNTNVNVDYYNADFGNSKYSPNAAAARSYLINDMNWNLVDGGPA